MGCRLVVVCNIDLEDGLSSVTIQMDAIARSITEQCNVLVGYCQVKTTRDIKWYSDLSLTIVWLSITKYVGIYIVR